MADDVQISMLEVGERDGELMPLSVDEQTLTPNSEMAPGELSARDFADLQVRGAIYPIIVVPTPQGTPWAYEVKDGRRRLRAYRRLYAAGLGRFASINALVFTAYSEEDAETWGSNVNHRRSHNAASDLECVLAVLERYPEVQPETKDGRRFLSQKTGIPISTLGKLLKMLDLPQAFIQGAREQACADRNPSRMKVPQGGLELIAALGQQSQKNLLNKLRDSGSISMADIQGEKANETAARVAGLQHLPGFGELPVVGFSVGAEPLVSVSSEWIRLSDAQGQEIASWSSRDWTEDPALVFAIVNTLKFAYENGTEALRGEGLG
jgi:hypothetical protein